MMNSTVDELLINLFFFLLVFKPSDEQKKKQLFGISGIVFAVPDANSVKDRFLNIQCMQLIHFDARFNENCKVNFSTN